MVQNCQNYIIFTTKMLLDNQKMTNNIQFEKWTADQVAEWLRGDNSLNNTAVNISDSNNNNNTDLFHVGSYLPTVNLT